MLHIQNYVVLPKFLMGQVRMDISHREIYALVDINNCYVSCERLFDPKLIGVPVVVLSNNDGCVVSRSEEAKNMGIKMAIPWYQIEEEALQAGVHVYSSN